MSDSISDYLTLPNLLAGVVAIVAVYLGYQLYTQKQDVKYGQNIRKNMKELLVGIGCTFSDKDKTVTCPREILGLGKQFTFEDAVGNGIESFAALVKERINAATAAASMTPPPPQHGGGFADMPRAPMPHGGFAAPPPGVLYPPMMPQPPPPGYPMHMPPPPPGSFQAVHGGPPVQNRNMEQGGAAMNGMMPFQPIQTRGVPASSTMGGELQYDPRVY